MVRKAQNREKAKKAFWGGFFDTKGRLWGESKIPSFFLVYQRFKPLFLGVGGWGEDFTHKIKKCFF